MDWLIGIGIAWVLLLMTYAVICGLYLVSLHLELKGKQFDFEREMQNKLDAEEEGYGRYPEEEGRFRQLGDDDDWGMQ